MGEQSLNEGDITSLYLLLDNVGRGTSRDIVASWDS
jgi:hypothetical protein